MIAVDTNILVRFLVRDDEAQAEAVRRRLKKPPAARTTTMLEAGPSGSLHPIPGFLLSQE